MKRSKISLVAVSAVVFAGVLGCAPHLRAQENRECTNATIKGTYAAKQNGTHFDDRGITAGVGVHTFDGEGHWSNDVTYANQRGISHGTASGNYTVSSDCTGSGDADGRVPFNFVIIDEGKEVLMIVASPDRVVTWTLKRQFPRRRASERK